MAALVASIMLSAPPSLAADAVAQQTLVESIPFGAVFGILGLAAALASYSSQGKVRVLSSTTTRTPFPIN